MASKISAPDDSDPVIASYNIFLTRPNPADSPEGSIPAHKLLLLQYPSHRPASRPYNVANSQKPTALRMKSNTGLLELDVPMLTREHYNLAAGYRYRKSLKQSRVTKEGGTHGLAGGFNTTSSGRPHQNLHDTQTQDLEDDSPEEELQFQTLGGKIATPASGDPLYMIGTFNEDGLHLSRLNAVAQLRPELHHVDAQDELERKRTSAAAAAGLGRSKSNLETGAPKLETKAIDIKVKNPNDDGRDRGMNANARLLRDIQAEPWQSHSWHDTDESDNDVSSAAVFRTRMHHSTPASQLKSRISNSEWLDRMSAPREAGHGKKGLLAKLRGRERERARRKKNEEEKARKAKEKAELGIGGLIQEDGGDGTDGSESELSELESERSGDEGDPIDITGDAEGEREVEAEVEVKQEETPVVAATPPLPSLRRRGRPKKSDVVMMDN